MPTIDDVSKLANVSRATVSRVLTGTRGVREESREAVLRAVEELNYRPSFAAQNLASNTSNQVGMVLPAQEADFSAALLPQLSLAVKSLNKSLLIQYVNDATEQKAAIESLQHQCVAVVTLGKPGSDVASNVIAFDDFSTAGSANQGYNYAFATESACRYVLGKGHRNIALLMETENDVASKQMLEGYRSVLQNYSLPFNRQLLVMANNNIEQALLTLINSFTKYTAIIAKRDSYAAEAMRLLREFNVAIPQEVSLMSLEDSPMASLLYPPLTCIAYPVDQLLDHCVQRIKALIDGHSVFVPEGRTFTGRLVARASVADIS
ncbi:LacI family DNA-binding transcriptional regulator [Enterobacter sp. RHBSTW-00994]|uniref:LacI family DNA-binding transcriptional regulator n=1 Tax=Enterobacter sp. RHBSTW-00994 TaxID=2742676 RepID=UPI0015E98239|nr:LacI family DNA-binding transcriptional regulator [Enterobacter sp. RHBSTW-00994]QLR41224.1 LacI family DNA-binding transcriptional regulator [Enterobacter sp. RHBSTW-00994]